MEKLFVCDEIEPLMRAFTPEQRAESLVLTTQQLRDGGPRPSVKWLFSTWGMAQLTENEINGRVQTCSQSETAFQILKSADCTAASKKRNEYVYRRNCDQR